MEYSISDFYVGQEVQVKEWDKMVEEFGVRQDSFTPIILTKYKFPESRKYLCGCTGVVSDIGGVGEDKFVLARIKGIQMAFGCDELIPVEMAKTIQHDAFSESLFLSLLSCGGE